VFRIKGLKGGGEKKGPLYIGGGRGEGRSVCTQGEGFNTVIVEWRGRKRPLAGGERGGGGGKWLLFCQNRERSKTGNCEGKKKGKKFINPHQKKKKKFVLTGKKKGHRDFLVLKRRKKKDGRGLGKRAVYLKRLGGLGGKWPVYEP